MDNQQIRRVDELKRRIATLGWLAGMIDADGCVAFMTRTRRGYTNHAPYVDVASVCPATIEILVKAFHQVEVACWVSKASTRGLQGVRVLGVKRAYNLLTKVVPYMVTKYEEAYLTLAWCKSRIESMGSTTFEKGNACQKGVSRQANVGYSEYENSLIAAVKELKSARNLRDYMPNPWWLFQGEDIVRTSEETSRTQAEMT